jgi:hypothetical protein
MQRYTGTSNIARERQLCFHKRQVAARRPRRDRSCCNCFVVTTSIDAPSPSVGALGEGVFALGAVVCCCVMSLQRKLLTIAIREFAEVLIQFQSSGHASIASSR